MESINNKFDFIHFSENDILEKIKNRNPSSSFLPVNTKADKFCWSVVIGNMLGAMQGKSIGKYTYDMFCDEIKASLDDANNSNAWPILHKAYFEEKNIFSISPKFLMFHASKTNGAATRVSGFYSSLLANKKISFKEDYLNFLEKKFAIILDKNLEEVSESKQNNLLYLPFIGAFFSNDLKWLANNPRYFLREIENFLVLYGFLYATQLSLSITSWNINDVPTVKPLFFILENEKANKERTFIQQYGYQSYKKGAEKLFPFLTMNEMLQLESSQKLPLWKLVQAFKEYENQNALLSYMNRLLAAFITHRKLDNENSSAITVEEAVKTLCSLSVKQFEKGTTRYGINKKYTAAIDSYFGEHFIQARGRVGKVLVLSQEMILLLTNLVIADNERLRFSKVIQEFQARGIYLDTQSEQALLAFYDRISNIERLSDSGDAVYVYKTI